ncbi:MAG: TonB-dependent receptor [Acidobacteria bacterium]|nr:TonB-dependent receptor [Acidobacteriota bacterium]
MKVRGNRILPRSSGGAFPVMLTWVALWCSSAGAVAQTSPASIPATIHGNVQSADGFPLPGAAVQAKEIVTGRSHSTSADSQGLYRLPDLAPGRYELQVSQAGFSSHTVRPLELAPGQSVARNFVLEPASSQDGASQTDSGATARERAASTASRISESQLAGLPLNGRSYSQLATLQAGISDPSAASGSRGVGSGNLTVSGGRTFSNSYLMDGTNIMDTENQAPRSAAGVQLGSDAVYQVQVFSTNFSAEYGRGGGGVLNSITRSGTSQWHGSIFEYLRNSKLDARNFFDYDPQNPTGRSAPPPFKRNQFGFTITGPVVKEKTFFMASYEGLRDRLTITDLSYYPDEQARLGELTDETGRVVERITVDPAVKPYLDLYPLPNDIRFGRGLGRNFSAIFLPTDESFFTVRVDQKLSERDSLFARYTFDDATSHNRGGISQFKTVSRSRQQYLTVAGSHIFSLNVLDSFRFGFTRPVSRTDNLNLIEIPTSLFFVPGAAQFGQIQMPALDAFGPNPSYPSESLMESFQFANDLIVQRGPHTLKFGLQVHRYRWDVESSWNEGGVWSFNSLESFLQGPPPPVCNEPNPPRTVDCRPLGKPGTSLTVALPGSNNFRAFRQTYAGFYVQDEYDVSSRLQLSLGLRYEFVTHFRDLEDKIVALPDRVHGTQVQKGVNFFKENPSLRSFAPRLGITWAPWSGRSTVFSWGAGIYYDQIIGNVATQRKSSAPHYRLAVNPTFDAFGIFPDALKGAVDVPFRIQVMDYLAIKTPTIYRYNFSVQQQFPGGWRMQASYVGARGNHLVRRYEANQYPVPEVQPDGSLLFPAQCPPPHEPQIAGCRAYAGPINPAFGAMSVISTDSQSFYNSLQISANKSLSGGLSLGASYSFSKSIDDSSTGPNGDFGQYPLMRTLDRGLSDFDLRQRLAVNYFYTLPWGGGQRWWKDGLLSRVFGGWRLGGIVNLRSGVPYTPVAQLRYQNFLFETQRPNLAPGRSNNPTQGVSSGCGRVAAGTKLEAPDLYYDPCAFEAPPPGTIGNLGRNTIIAPRVVNLDISLQREFLLDAKRRLQFRADIFNWPNHTNFNRNLASSIVVFSGLSGNTARRNSTAARIGSAATTSRQIQFALRFSF